MNREPMECPNCKEITLTHFNTETDTSVGSFEEWKCPECGHYQTMDYVPKYPGWDAFVKEVGLDKIDMLGKMEAMQIAFMGGRSYEATRTIEQLKPLNEQLAE